VSFAATLEDLSFPELLHLISFNKKSGKLTLTCREGQALILFRQGRIIYAASDKLRESFGSILLRHGAVTEADLMEALERQDWLARERRLGSILVEMGRVSPDDARKALREQAQWVFTEVFRWRKGFFKFEALELASGGETELALDEALPREGFDTEEVLLEVVTRLDENGEPELIDDEARRKNAGGPSHFRVPPQWEDATAVPRMASWESVMSEIRAPTFTGEIALALLRYAAQLMSRGLLFLVGSQGLLSTGHFGLPQGIPGRRRIRVPLDEPSVFQDVVTTRESFRGPMPRHFWNDHFLEQLGGGTVTEVVAIPMIIRRKVGFVFYGDNAGSQAPIGSTQPLEFLMVEASRAMDKLADEITARKLPPKPEGAGTGRPSHSER
jgi:hypothetical protein